MIKLSLFPTLKYSWWESQLLLPSVHKMKLLRANSLPFPSLPRLPMHFPPPLLQFLTIPPLGFFFRFPCTVNFPGWVGGGIVRIDCLAKHTTVHLGQQSKPESLLMDLAYYWSRLPVSNVTHCNCYMRYLRLQASSCLRFTFQLAAYLRMFVSTASHMWIEFGASLKKRFFMLGLGQNRNILTF